MAESRCCQWWCLISAVIAFAIFLSYWQDAAESIHAQVGSNRFPLHLRQPTVPHQASLLQAAPPRKSGSELALAPRPVPQPVPKSGRHVRPESISASPQALAEVKGPQSWGLHLGSAAAEEEATEARCAYAAPWAEACNSSVVWHEVHPDGLRDLHRPELAEELRNVVVQGGRLVFHGLPQAQVARLRMNPPPDYKWFTFGSPETSPVKTGMTFEKQPLNLATDCDDRISGTSLLLPPHIPSHVHHLHNDLILKVAFILHRFQLPPKSTRLYLLRGGQSHTEYPHRNLMFHLLDGVLRDVVWPFEDVSRRSRLCHERILWTPTWSWRSRWEPYYFLAGRWGNQNWRGVVNNWVGLVRTEFGVEGASDASHAARRCRELTSGARPRLFFLSRRMGGNPRRIENENVLTDVLSKTFEVTLLGTKASDFANPHGLAAREPLTRLLSQLASADVFMGLFGNGLQNALYLRTGAILVELHGCEDGWYPQRLFVNLASHRGLSYYVAELLRFRAGGQQGIFVLPRDYMDTLAADVLDRLKQECTHQDEPPATGLWYTEPGWDSDEPRCSPADQLFWADGALRDSRLSAFKHSRCYLVRTGRSWGITDYVRARESSGVEARQLYSDIAGLSAGALSQLPEGPKEVCAFAQARRWTTLLHGADPVLLQRFSPVGGTAEALVQVLEAFHFGRTLASLQSLRHYAVVQGEGGSELLKSLPSIYLPSDYKGPGVGRGQGAGVLCGCPAPLAASVLGSAGDGCSRTERAAAAAALLGAEPPFREAALDALERSLNVSAMGPFLRPLGPPADLAVHFACPSVGGGLVPLSAYTQALASVPHARGPSVDVVALASPEPPGSDCAELWQKLGAALASSLPAGTRVRMRAEARAEDAFAALALAQRTLCAPGEGSAASLCFWAAFASFDGWLLAPKGSSGGATQPVPDVTLQLPGHMRWLHAPILPAAAAQGRAPLELVQWVTSK